jgi:phage portal protein BeeE
VKWPWTSDRSPAAELRDMDISIDDYAATYLNYDGNTYPVSVFGGDNGAWQFGGYAPVNAGRENEEDSSDDFEGLVGGIYKAVTPVFSVHNYRRSLFCEARFAIQPFSSDGRPGELIDYSELNVLRQPWPGATTRDLLSKALTYADMGGNCFLVRDIKNGTDQIKLLRPDWTMILMSGDPLKVADVEPVALVYKPGRTEDTREWVVYPFDGSNGRIAHWAPIPDPHAEYRGMSWLTPIMREALIDKAVRMTTLRHFQNGARPGIIASFDPSITPEQAKEFQALFNQTKVGASNAHKPLFLGGGCDVSTLNLQMDDFDKISSVGELRVASAGQVPPTLIGLTEAMKGSALNEGNFQAAKDSFADGTMRPLWGSFSEAIARIVDVPPNSRLWYDDRDIAFLRQDQQLIATRKTTDATTISVLIQAGYEPDAAVKYVMEDNYKALLGDGHTGLFSVQLIPPGEGHATDFQGDSGPTPGTTQPKNTPPGQATEKDS